MRRIGSGMATVLISVLLVAACGGSGTTGAVQTVTLRISTVTASPDVFFSHGLTAWRDLVQQKSNGKLKLQIFMGTITTDAVAEAKDVQAGTIDGAVTDTTSFSSIYPSLGVLDLWFLLSGYPQLAKVLQGPLGQQWIKGIDQAGVGITALDFWYSSFFQLGTLKPVATPDQIAGLRIRVLPSPVGIAYTKAIGANPTPLAYGELYSALQTHLIDGVGTNLSGFTGIKLQELIKYVTLLNFQAQGALLFMNEAKFKSLSPNFQQILMDTAKTMATTELGYVEASDQSQQKVMSDAGVQIITPTPDQRQQWVTKARTADAQFATQFGQSVINQISNTT